MASKKDIIITEDLTELRQLLKSERNSLLSNRIRCLIFLKEKKFKKRKELADHLFIGYTTLKRWLKTYRESGIESLLSIKKRTGRKSTIPQHVHNALRDRLHDSQSPFLSYKEAAGWVFETFSIEIKTDTLRSYMVRHFKSKLKRPRKSHYKKDPQAVEAFKKTACPGQVI